MTEYTILAVAFTYGFLITAFLVHLTNGIDQ